MQEEQVEQVKWEGKWDGGLNWPPLRSQSLYIYIHIYTYTYTCMYMNMCVRMYTYIYIHIYITCECICMYAYTYICVRVCKLLEMEMDRRWRELIPFLERASCWELLQLMLLELKFLEPEIGKQQKSCKTSVSGSRFCHEEHIVQRFLDAGLVVTASA